MRCVQFRQFRIWILVGFGIVFLDQAILRLFGAPELKYTYLVESEGSGLKLPVRAPYSVLMKHPGKNFALAGQQYKVGKEGGFLLSGTGSEKILVLGDHEGLFMEPPYLFQALSEDNFIFEQLYLFGLPDLHLTQLSEWWRLKRKDSLRFDRAYLLLGSHLLGDQHACLQGILVCHSGLLQVLWRRFEFLDQSKSRQMRFNQIVSLIEEVKSNLAGKKVVLLNLGMEENLKTMVKLKYDQTESSIMYFDLSQLEEKEQADQIVKILDGRRSLP